MINVSHIGEITNENSLGKEEGITLEIKIDYINSYLRTNENGLLSRFTRNRDRGRVDKMYDILKNGGRIGETKDHKKFIKSESGRNCEEKNPGVIQCRLMDKIIGNGYTSSEAKFFSKYILKTCYDMYEGDFKSGEICNFLNHIEKMGDLLPTKVPLWPTGYYG